MQRQVVEKSKDMSTQSWIKMNRINNKCVTLQICKIQNITFWCLRYTCFSLTLFIFTFGIAISRHTSPQKLLAELVFSSATDTLVDALNLPMLDCISSTVLVIFLDCRTQNKQWFIKKKHFLENKLFQRR